jgi:hypothetical protein
VLHHPGLSPAPALWRGPDITAARTRSIRAALAPPARVLVIEPGEGELSSSLFVEGYLATAFVGRPGGTGPRSTGGAQVVSGDLFEVLDGIGLFDAIVAPGLLPLLAPAELRRAVPELARILSSRGLIYFDAPDPSAETSLLDPAARRPISRDTVTLLCVSAGLECAAMEDPAPGWWALIARAHSG